MKITGVITLSSAGLTAQRTNGGDTTVYDVSLTDGDWFVIGDATASDLLEELESKIQAVGGGTPFANLAITLDSAGIVSMVLGAGETGTLDWTANGGATDVRDWLRYSGSTTSLTDVASSGSRTHKAGFYPARSAIDDLERYPSASVQAIADNGQAYTLSYPSRTEWNLTILASEANPQALVHNEFTALDDLMRNHAQQGKRFRYYRDVTVSTAYAQVTNPKGFLELVPIVPLDWNPLSGLLEQGWYQYFRQALDSLVYVA
jgi:hypothetical protein